MVVRTDDKKSALSAKKVDTGQRYISFPLSWIDSWDNCKYINANGNHFQLNYKWGLGGCIATRPCLYQFWSIEELEVET